MSDRGPDPRVPGYLGRILGRGGEPAGTCFQVSLGVVATAWHVLEVVDAGDVGARVTVDPLGGGKRRNGEIAAIDALADLALLRLTDPLEDSVAGLAATDEVTINAEVLVTGVSRLEDPGHEHRYLDAPARWAGGTTRDELALGRLICRDVLPGMSGAPVRLSKDDVVVGVVSGRYNSADGWLRDSVWVARCESLEALCVQVGPGSALSAFSLPQVAWVWYYRRKEGDVKASQVEMRNLKSLCADLGLTVDAVQAAILPGGFGMQPASDIPGFPSACEDYFDAGNHYVQAVDMLANREKFELFSFDWKQHVARLGEEAIAEASRVLPDPIVRHLQNALALDDPAACLAALAQWDGLVRKSLTRNLTVERQHL